MGETSDIPGLHSGALEQKGHTLKISNAKVCKTCTFFFLQCPCHTLWQLKKIIPSWQKCIARCTMSRSYSKTLQTKVNFAYSEYSFSFFSSHNKTTVYEHYSLWTCTVKCAQPSRHGQITSRTHSLKAKVNLHKRTKSHAYTAACYQERKRVSKLVL